MVIVRREKLARVDRVLSPQVYNAFIKINIVLFNV